jgi:hypothetical protein
MSDLSNRKSDTVTSRPFHLWNPNLKDKRTGQMGKRVPHRYYAIKENARWAILRELDVSAIGTTLELIDVAQGKSYGSYRRKIHSIAYL